VCVEEFGRFADDCVLYPVLVFEIPVWIQFHQFDEFFNSEASMNLSNFRHLHRNISAEEFSKHPFALLAGRAFRVTLKVVVPAVDGPVEFAMHHMCALLQPPLSPRLVLILREWNFIFLTEWRFGTKSHLRISSNTTSAQTLHYLRMTAAWYCRFNGATQSQTFTEF
jgi:hypothetical protein